MLEKADLQMDHYLNEYGALAEFSLLTQGRMILWVGLGPDCYCCVYFIFIDMCDNVGCFMWILNKPHFVIVHRERDSSSVFDL